MLEVVLGTTELVPQFVLISIHEYFSFFSESSSWFDCFSELSSLQLTFGADLVYILAYRNPLSSAYKKIASLLELLVITCLTPKYSW